MGEDDELDEVMIKMYTMLQAKKNQPGGLSEGGAKALAILESKDKKVE